MHLLDVFSSSSGQTINYHKSGVYFSKSVHPKHCKILAKIHKVKRISKDDKYLGTPLFFSRTRSLNFEPLLEKAYKSLHGWKAKILAQARRTVLINSTLSAYPSHQMQCFMLPTKTLDAFDKVQRDFWWSKKNPKKIYLS